MDNSRPVAQPERHPAHGEAFDQHYPTFWLDGRRALEREGIDPDEFIAKIRATGNREAEKRGLLFTGEERLGQEIARQYRKPTWWRRLRLYLGWVHVEAPLDDEGR